MPAWCMNSATAASCYPLSQCFSGAREGPPPRMKAAHRPLLSSRPASAFGIALCRSQPVLPAHPLFGPLPGLSWAVKCVTSPCASASGGSPGKSFCMHFILVFILGFLKMLSANTEVSFKDRKLEFLSQCSRGRVSIQCKFAGKPAPRHQITPLRTDPRSLLGPEQRPPHGSPTSVSSLCCQQLCCACG